MSQSKYEGLIYKYADKYGIPRDLAIKQVKQESSFNPAAVSGAGAGGLMQLMPATAKDLGLSDADRFDPEKNVEAGMRYMAQLKKRYKGDMALTLAAYNAGMGNVDKHKGIPPFKETQDYVAKILGTVPGTIAARPTIKVPERAQPEPRPTPLQKKLAAREGSILPDDPALRMADPTADSVATSTMVGDRLADVSMAGRDAGVATFGESFADGLRENVTGALLDEYRSGMPDRQFITNMREGKYNEVIDAQPWQTDPNARGYVQAAQNEEDFNRRLAITGERSEFATRMNNANGWQGVNVVAAGFIGQMADPVAIGVSLGTGIAANTMMRGAVIAAAENVAMGAFIDHQQNREITPESVLLNATLGGTLGGIGGTFAARANARRLLADELAMQNQVMGEADALTQRVEANTQFTDSPTTAWDDALVDFEMPAIPRVPDDVTIAPMKFDEYLSNLRNDDVVNAADGLYRPLFETGIEVDMKGTASGPALSVDTFNNSLDTIAAKSTDPVSRQLATKLRSAIDDVKVALNDMSDPQVAAAVRQHGIAGRAFYDGISDRARIAAKPDEAGRIAERTLLHEGTHVATLGATILRDKVNAGTILPGNLTPNQRKAVAVANRMNDMFMRYKAALGKRTDGVYGFTNLDEFVAEVASPDFRRLLASVDGPKATGIKSVLQDVIAKIKEWLGIPKSEKAPDYLETVFELMDASGNLRKAEDIPAWTPDFTFGGAFSRNLEEDAVSATQLKASARRAKFDEQVKDWDDSMTATDQQRRTAQKVWYESARPAVINKNEKYLDSPGLIAQGSKSKVVRYWGAHIMEDAPGRGKRVNDTAALEAAKLQLKWQHQYIPAVRSEIVKLMSPAERIAFALGNTTAQKRISRDIAMERLRRREAVKAGTQYKSDAPDSVQRAADLVDQFYEDALQTGMANGVERAAAAMNTPGGYHGYMPYQWNWQELNRVFREDPAAWNGVVSNMKSQYRNWLIGPAMEKLRAKGDVDPTAAAEALARVDARVEHLVSVKLQKLMADPESRIMGNDMHIAGIAEELLLENFQGGRVTEQMASDFKAQLSEVMQDFSRTEMDLATEINGVSLLDYMNYDAIQQVEREARSLSGLTGLARKGVYEKADVAAIMESARADGATPVELEALNFGFRSLGIGNMKNGKEHAVATALRDGAHMALMGKLGFSILAELPGAMAQLGVGAVLRSFPMSFYRSPIMRQMSEINPALSGLQHRIQTLSNVEVGARGMDTSSQFLNLLRRGRQVTDWISLANPISTGMHNMLVPTMIDQMIRGMRGKGGRFSAQQLDDAGLSPELVDLIKAQVEKHDPNYKIGQELNLEKWDTYAADQFLLAAHRVTDNIMTRAKVGERPMWQVESDLGSLAGQFRGAGYLAAEKHLVRAASTNEASRLALIGALSLSMGVMLQEARMYSATIGMGDKEREDYMAKRREWGSYAAGTAVMTNMSGLLPEGINIINLLAGNTPQGSNFVAGMGFLDAGFAAMSAPADVLSGDSEKAAKKVFKVLPAGNSILMQTIMNSMTAED